MKRWHPIIDAVGRAFWAQPEEERALVRQQREKTLSFIREQRAALAADPATTRRKDLATLDDYVRMAEGKLGVLPLEEREKRDERRRMQTRERVRRHRAAKKQPA